MGESSRTPAVERWHRGWWMLPIVAAVAAAPFVWREETEPCPDDWLDERTELTVSQQLRHTAGMVVTQGSDGLNAIADAVDDYEQQISVATGHEAECRDTFVVPVTYVLVMSTLASHPEFASPELLALLHRVGGERGMAGIYELVGSMEIPVERYPGLLDLQHRTVRSREVHLRATQLRDQLAG
jgi:hypothetical protein